MTEISITTHYMGSYTPSDREFWEEVELELEGAAFLLTRVHVETREEALSGSFRGSKRKDSSGMEVIRRRNISSSFDQLDHYYELGRILLPRAARLIEERRFTTEFVRIWMDLQVCHGFLIAHYMDNSDDMTAHRGGANVPKEIAAQKKWLCHYLADRIKCGKTLKEASEEAFSEVNRRIKSSPTGEFSTAWYQRMISSKNDDFTASLRTSHRLFTEEILRIASEPRDGLPPL